MNTFLSQKDTTLLEDVIGRYGHIASFNDLKKIFHTYKDAELRQKIALLAKRGWLVRVKKGLYIVVSDITSLSLSNISPLRIALALNQNSYISLASALHYHGLIDQLLHTVTSITDARTKRYQFQGFTFTFSKVQKDFYFGYTEKRVEGKLVKIADLEKVVLDYLYLKKDAYSLNVLWGTLSEHTDEFDLGKLQRYALRCNLTLRRTAGFLLDQLDADSTKLYTSVKSHNGYSRLTSDSKKFNAKWRLYYDYRITE